ncbi:uncharacterized protein LOC120073564 [Benincasa hispida]|uniref:uncharacterized protein LOC120073564 n=1 Tax=Benincasa hispida TaxID=102211 RepID=UPI0019003D56|nr:uncharacterized protein LOC120073564 [Benincasa hispida]
MEECPLIPAHNASQAVRDAYDHWTKANDKTEVYILASLSDVFIMKHKAMIITCQIMESLLEIFGQLSSQIRHETLKYVCNACIKEGQSVKKHVLDLMVHFNVAEMNGTVIDE